MVGHQAVHLVVPDHVVRNVRPAPVHEARPHLSVRRQLRGELRAITVQVGRHEHRVDAPTDAPSHRIQLVGHTLAVDGGLHQIAERVVGVRGALAACLPLAGQVAVVAVCVVPSCAIDEAILRVPQRIGVKSYTIDVVPVLLLQHVVDPRRGHAPALVVAVVVDPCRGRRAVVHCDGSLERTTQRIGNNRLFESSSSRRHEHPRCQVSELVVFVLFTCLPKNQAPSLAGGIPRNVHSACRPEQAVLVVAVGDRRGLARDRLTRHTKVAIEVAHDRPVDRTRPRLHDWQWPVPCEAHTLTVAHRNRLNLSGDGFVLDVHGRRARLDRAKPAESVIRIADSLLVRKRE